MDTLCPYHCGTKSSYLFTHDPLSLWDMGGSGWRKHRSQRVKEPKAWVLRTPQLFVSICLSSSPSASTQGVPGCPPRLRMLLSHPPGAWLSLPLRISPEHRNVLPLPISQGNHSQHYEPCSPRLHGCEDMTWRMGCWVSGSEGPSTRAAGLGPPCCALLCLWS